jgi:CDP-paratose 2-epimerase
MSTPAIVITGGAGFIGCNLADALLRDGERVIVLDNLSRAGVERNASWLKAQHGERVEIARADVRRPSEIEPILARALAVFHFAAQTAVTTSLLDPIDDFEINARGTLNVLEAVRRAGNRAPVIFSSTNKVYGSLDDVGLTAPNGRYEPTDQLLGARGIDEDRPLAFCTPYGCSKGVADQYVLDYAKSYGLPTAVLRMSCIYGPRQFGTEDQGWVAHFILRALRGEPLTIYGDGRQVRDILYIDDLVDAFLLAEEQGPQLTGRAFNIGGGPGSMISLLDLIDRIEALHGRRPDVSFDDWRTGDQRYYVSDTRAFQQASGWQRRVDAEDGIERLYRWLADQQQRPAPVAQSLDRAPADAS